MDDTKVIERLQAASMDLYDVTKEALAAHILIPDMLVIIDDNPESTELPHNYNAVALGGDEKDSIPEILRHFPKVQAYGLIMHSTAWFLPKDSKNPGPRPSIEEFKKVGIKKDCLVLNLIQKSKSSLVRIESYEKDEDGMISWHDELENHGIPLSSEHNPFYANALLTEEDFE